MWGDVEVTGWIADGPAGQDEAYLLATPTGTGQVDPAPAMADLIAEMGLAAGDVRAAPGLTAELDGDTAIVRAHGTEMFRRPTADEWADTARAAGRVVLVIGTRPVRGDVDAYTSRYGSELALALLPLE